MSHSRHGVTWTPGKVTQMPTESLVYKSGAQNVNLGPGAPESAYSPANSRTPLKYGYETYAPNSNFSGVRRY